jgi:hypothetical protein
MNNKLPLYEINYYDSNFLDKTHIAVLPCSYKRINITSDSGILQISDNVYKINPNSEFTLFGLNKIIAYSLKSKSFNRFIIYFKDSTKLEFRKIDDTD